VALYAGFFVVLAMILFANREVGRQELS